MVFYPIGLGSLKVFFVNCLNTYCNKNRKRFENIFSLTGSPRYVHKRFMCKELKDWLDQPGNTGAGLGRDIGVSRMHVHNMATGARKITAELAVKIEDATGGAVRREDMRPDLWPSQNRESDNATNTDAAA